MSLQWLLGLYGPAKDVVRALNGRNSKGLILTVTAQAQGARTWLSVTARAKRDGEQVTVLKCRAEIYADFAGCIGPRPVRTDIVRFMPMGSVTVGSMPVRWEAFVLNEHIRRESVRRDDEALHETYGKRTDTVRLEIDKADRAREEWFKKHSRLGLVNEALSGPPGFQIRVILDTLHHGQLVTDDATIPPRLPLGERLEAALGALRRGAGQSGS